MPITWTTKYYIPFCHIFIRKYIDIHASKLNFQELNDFNFTLLSNRNAFSIGISSYVAS
jgi:hypothetical protein